MIPCSSCRITTAPRPRCRQSSEPAQPSRPGSGQAQGGAGRGALRPDRAPGYAGTHFIYNGASPTCPHFDFLNTGNTMLQLTPLSLYIHVPWCVQKCPYCDFNSHAQKGELPHLEYVAALLEESGSGSCTGPRGVRSPPSSSAVVRRVCSPVEAMQALLDGVRARIVLTPDCEITMEANPGTVEAEQVRRLPAGRHQPHLHRGAELPAGKTDPPRPHPRPGRGTQGRRAGPRHHRCPPSTWI